MQRANLASNHTLLALIRHQSYYKILHQYLLCVVLVWRHYYVVTNFLMICYHHLTCKCFKKRIISTKIDCFCRVHTHTVLYSIFLLLILLYTVYKSNRIYIYGKMFVLFLRTKGFEAYLVMSFSCILIHKSKYWILMGSASGLVCLRFLR